MRTKALKLSELTIVNLQSARSSERIYLEPGLAGQAFSRWSCQLCKEEQPMQNTAVPRLCSECSDAFKLCVRCGGTLDCRQKSRFDRKAGRKKATP